MVAIVVFLTCVVGLVLLGKNHGDCWWESSKTDCRNEQKRFTPTLRESKLKSAFRTKAHPRSPEGGEIPASIEGRCFRKLLEALKERVWKDRSREAALYELCVCACACACVSSSLPAGVTLAVEQGALWASFQREA